MGFKLLTFASLGVLLAGFILPGLTFATQKPLPGKKSGRPQPIPITQPPVPQQTPSQQQTLARPLPLEQIPATPPQVSFKSGELTIIARNSSLGAILQQVQTKTGASIDMPGTPAERVVGDFGPGPAREVLTALLNGSHFNYVLLGSPQDPNSLNRVVLLRKPSGSEDGSPASQTAAGSPAMLPGHGPFVVPIQQPEEMNGQDNAEEMADPEPNADETDQTAEQNGQPAIKTPQQLLQELQRQQQVQQQGAPQQQNPPQQ